MTATDSSKAKKRCMIYRECPAFLRRKCKISLVRRTGFVLPLEHPSGTKYVNSPQLQRFLDKNDKSPIRLFQCFCFPDLQEVVMFMWKPTGPIQRLAARSTPSTIAPLLLSTKFSAQFELNDFFDFFRLAVTDKMDTALLFLRRHLNLFCGMYCMINLVICFVTSYPRMTGLVNG